MAATSPESSLPALVFVPGEWHGPEIFDDVRANLNERGYLTEAATLATHGATDPNIGLAEDVANVRSKIEKLVKEGNDVVVVAHSYGGVPSSCAVEGLGVTDLGAQGKKGGVIMVVYVTSFAIESGASLLESVGGTYPSWWNVQGEFVTPSDPVTVFYGDVEPPMAEKHIQAISSMPLKAFMDISTFTPWENGIEVGYIYAEENQAVSLDIQIELSSQLPASSFTESLGSGHMPFLSMPETLSNTIDQAAKRAVARKPR
ncbi:unnamed protein product [Clonostachys rhizophaga]|uniref:AB hydrolase-1 domain-containing protein n=1 Tax=Clonostachys rhizophaga TaxID=160324 RepID=A0A9N9VAL3_9HYPO|nr:unnamed protein product [Clonostachys rhizophaga]